MRIVKEHDERRNEILDAATRLFNTKGYQKSTINDILKEVNIAKGTFYYYFKSKEEVLDAIVLQYTELIIERVNKVLEASNLSPDVKLLNVFMAMKIDDQIDVSIIDEMHKPENALLHQKMLNMSVSALTPLLVEVINEGTEKKMWSCQYPKEYMQIFLASVLTLTDDGIFELKKEEQMSVMIALLTLLEKMLELPAEYCQKLYMEYCSSIASKQEKGDM